MVSVEEQDVGRRRRHIRPVESPPRRAKTLMRFAKQDDDDDENGVNTSNQWTTTHRNVAANIVHPSASTDTVPTNSTQNNSNSTTVITWSPLRISGLMTLFITLLTYISLHVLAAQQRKRRRQSKQRIPPGSSHNRNDPSQRSNKISTTEQPQFSTTSQPPRRHTTAIDVDDDDQYDDDDDRSVYINSTTPCKSGDSNSGTNENLYYNLDCDDSNTSGHSTGSHLSITPLVVTTTNSSAVVCSIHDNTTSCNSNSSIPSTITAKQKKRGKRNSHSRVTSDMNERTSDTIATTSALILFGPHDEQDADQNNKSTNNHSIHGMTNNTNVQLSPSPPNTTGTATTATMNTTTTSVDDDEILFYEQTLQFNHHAQRENITLPISFHGPNYYSSSNDSVNQNHDIHHNHSNNSSNTNNKNNTMEDHFIIVAPSLWVSNEESFFFPSQTHTDL